MSAPSPLIGRGRGVARRRGFRQKPLRREGAGPEDEAAPVDAYTLPRTWRPMPLTESPDPARSHWLELLLHDPAAARRERLEARLAYWRARVEALEERFRIAKQAVQDALEPTEGSDEKPLPPAPAAVIHELRVERTVAWADVQAARAQLAEAEAELADA